MDVRMRVVGWQVQPVIMTDDGENLTPQEARPLFIPAVQWEAWAAGGWKTSLEGLRAEVEKVPAAPAELPGEPLPDRT